MKNIHKIADEIFQAPTEDELFQRALRDAKVSKSLADMDLEKDLKPEHLSILYKLMQKDAFKFPWYSPDYSFIARYVAKHAKDKKIIKLNPVWYTAELNEKNILVIEGKKPSMYVQAKAGSFIFIEK